MRQNFSDFNKYPHYVFASVILLDNKIVNWKTGNYRWTKNAWKISNHPQIVYINADKIVVRSRSFRVYNREQHNKSFRRAEGFYRQFELYDGYNLAKPY